MNLAFEIRRNGRYGRGRKSAANLIFKPVRRFQESALMDTTIESQLFGQMPASG
jgi:hypothetical protein